MHPCFLPHNSLSPAKCPLRMKWGYDFRLGSKFREAKLRNYESVTPRNHRVGGGAEWPFRIGATRPFRIWALYVIRAEPDGAGPPEPRRTPV